MGGQSDALGGSGSSQPPQSHTESFLFGFMEPSVLFLRDAGRYSAKTVEKRVGTSAGKFGITQNLIKIEEKQDFTVLSAPVKMEFSGK